MENFAIKECGGVSFGEILSLYESAGWINYTKRPQMLAAALENSLRTLGAFEGESGRLVGIIRVVGDGFSIIYIQDLIVLGEYQRRGVGSVLVAEIDKFYPDVYQKVMLTDDSPSLAAFYQNCGFTFAGERSCKAFIKV